MQFLEKEICQLMEAIWTDFLGMEIVPLAEKAIPNGEPAGLSSCLHITGGWDGMVTLSCPAQLAQQAATTMFGVEPDKVTEEQTLDAMAELTNMTGGNLKALMPPPCYISLPILTQHTDSPLRIPGSRLVTKVAFNAQGHKLVVSVLEREKKAAAQSA